MVPKKFYLDTTISNCKTYGRGWWLYYEAESLVLTKDTLSCDCVGEWDLEITPDIFTNLMKLLFCLLCILHS